VANPPKLNWNKWHIIDIPDLPKTGNCRYCKHTEWNHRPDERGFRPCNEDRWNAKCAPQRSRDLIIPNDYKLDCCPCMEYVPGDNLAFLEWKAKRGF